MNDPNGLIQWNGAYHVFYQHNPDAPRWGLIRWGHASSVDLVRWTDHGLALEPSSNGPDRDGCWSGSIVPVDGVPNAFYTGASGHGSGHTQSVCRAMSDGDLGTWRKDPSNPVISGEARPGRRHQRDPFLLRIGSEWLLLLGTGLVGTEGDGGAVVAYRSDDLQTWYDDGVFFSRPFGIGSIDTGPVWECPQLFRSGDRWILIVSIQARGGPDPICVGAVWFAGDLVEGRFRAEEMGWLDAGDVFYAPAILTEPTGRTLAWGWIQDPHADLSEGQGAVVGALSLPRVLAFEGSRLVTHPAPELARLHVGRPISLRGTALDVDQRLVVDTPDLLGGARHVCLELEGDGLAAANLVASSDGRRVTAVGISRGEAGDDALVLLEVLDDQVSVRHSASIPRQSVAIRLDIFVDGPIIEAFAGGAAIAARIDTRSLPDDRISLASYRGSARFTQADVFALEPASTIDQAGDGAAPPSRYPDQSGA